MSANWPRWAREKVRDFLTACLGTDWPGRAQQAARLLEELPREATVTVLDFTHRSRVTSRVTRASTGVDKSGLAFPPNAPGKSQDERREERNDRVFELRRNVLNRARRLFGGHCEFCRVGEAVEAHHVLGGSDRRALEHETNMAAVCAGGPGAAPQCHERTEASPDWDREQSLRWALRLAGDRRLSDEERAGFARTAELLESRIALAAAQARPVTRSTTEEGS